MLSHKAGEVVDPAVATGPVALRNSMHMYKEQTGRNVTVLPPGVVYAYDWMNV